jgi:ankyrin repeat protein
VNDLLDAAKYGDMEAVEDFLAIGKDVNMKDDVGRTPLVRWLGRI